MTVRSTNIRMNLGDRCVCFIDWQKVSDRVHWTIKADSKGNWYWLAWKKTD